MKNLIMSTTDGGVSTIKYAVFRAHLILSFISNVFSDPQSTIPFKVRGFGHRRMMAEPLSAKATKIIFLDYLRMRTSSSIKMPWRLEMLPGGQYGRKLPYLCVVPYFSSMILMSIYRGSGVGLIKSILPAGEVVLNAQKQTKEILQNLQSVL